MKDTIQPEMKGTIQQIDYTRGSGLATVIILTDGGDIEAVHADAGALFRALEASGAYPGVSISYATNNLGLMAWLGLDADAVQ